MGRGYPMGLQTKKILGGVSGGVGVGEWVGVCGFVEEK